MKMKIFSGNPSFVQIGCKSSIKNGLGLQKIRVWNRKYVLRMAVFKLTLQL